MKVAYLTEIPTPYRDPLLAKLSQRDGLQLEVLYCASTEKGRDWELGHEAYNAEILKGVNWTFQGDDTFVLKMNPSIWSRLSKGHYDAVVVGGYIHPTMQLAMLWCYSHKVPYIILSESQHLTPRSSVKRMLKKPLIELAVKGASAFLVMGSDGRDYLASYGADPEKIFCFPNTPDIEQLTREVALHRQQRCELRNQLNLKGEPLVLYVGRLVGVKNVETLMKAFQLAQREVPEAGLVIAGDGPLRRSLEELSTKLNLSNISFVGFIQPHDIAKYYAAADVFVLPSYNESWGVVVLEAMASGLPVVVSDKVGCARDLVHPEKSGFVVPAGDVNDWSSTLVKLLHDSDLRERIGTYAQELVAHWDYDFCGMELQNALAAAASDVHGK